jgi:hypothetical protein
MILVQIILGNLDKALPTMETLYLAEIKMASTASLGDFLIGPLIFN